MHSIILLHGALGAAQSMLPLSKALDDVAAVHILDFSGHGEARWPEAGFTMEVFEEDVLRLMDSRDLQSATIFGYSLGGFVGLRLAKKYPERINSVITLATKFDWTEETCAKEASMLDPDALAAKVPKFTAGLAQVHTRNGWVTVMNETRNMLQGMSQYRFSSDDLAAIQTPVRLMVGDRDKMVRMDETREVFRGLPKAEFAVLPGTPHPLEAVNRELLATLVRTALDIK